MSVEIRRIGHDDWALLRDVRLRALADCPDAFAATLEQARAQPEAVWRERAASPGPTMVAIEDGRGVAMGGVFVPADGAAAYVWGMWTAPEARGRGYAAAILRELLAWCRERGLELRLHVTEGNDIARNFHVAHGFRSTGAWEPLREGATLRVEELALPP